MRRSAVLLLIILLSILGPPTAISQELIKEPIIASYEPTDYATIDKTNGVLELTKYDVKTSISRPDKKPVSSQTVSEVTTLTYSDAVHRIYPTPKGIKWDIILDEQPTGDTWSFKVDSYLDWYYQPPLTDIYTEKECPGWTVSDTHAYDEKGDLRVYVPEDVVGSYAVYYGKHGNQYGTGKYMHLYRPLVYDANGVEIWGELDYIDGVLTVSVSRAWLDDPKRAYPVTVDPTIGHTTVGASTLTYGADSMRFSNGTTDGSGGELQTVHFYGRTVNGTGKIYGGCYNSTLNLTEGETTGLSLTGAFIWNNITMSGSTTLDPNTNYWAAVHIDTLGSDIEWKGDWQGVGGKNSSYNLAVWPGSWADPVSFTDYVGYRYSIYATYNLTGGGANITATNIIPETNGYNSIVVAQFNASEVVNVTHDGTLVDFTITEDNYIQFEVRHSETYTVYTNATVDASSYENSFYIHHLNYTSGDNRTRHYGFVPSLKANYTIDIGWDHGDGGYLSIGGVYLRYYSGLTTDYLLGSHKDDEGNTITDFNWNLGNQGKRIIISVLSDPSTGNATVYCAGNSQNMQMYWPSWIEDQNTYIYTPMVVSLVQWGSAETKVYELWQGVNATGFITAIGSNKYQACGWDGPHTQAQCGAGMTEMIAMNMNGTIYADVDYDANTTWRDILITYLDAGFDLGIHFTNTMTGWTWEDQKSNMTAEYNDINGSYGRKPTNWCILGVGSFNNYTKHKWVIDNLDMWCRRNRVIPQGTSGSHDLTNSTFAFFDNATTAGYACIPLYLHDTEIDPAPVSSISSALFDLYLDHINASDVRLTDYDNWYGINSNQGYALFTFSGGDIHTIEKHGANNYNVTYADDTETNHNSAYDAIQSCINSSKVVAGDVIHIEAGNYRLNSSLTGKSGITIDGERGTVFNVTGIAGSSTVFSLIGTIANTTGITGPVSEGDTNLTLTSDMGVSAGDMVFLYSSEVWHNNSANQKKGELLNVSQVNGTTISFTDQVWDNYTQPLSNVSLINVVENFTISDISFVNEQNAWDTYPSVTEKSLVGFRVIYGRNIVVDNCTFDGIEDRAIRFDSVLGAEILDSTFNKTTKTGSGYGVDITYACQDIVIDNCLGQYNRHFVVATDTTTLSGIPRNITVQNCEATDSKYWTGVAWGVQNIYDSHQVGEQIHFINNTASGSGYGLNYMSFSGNITGNTFHDLTFFGITVASSHVAGINQYQDLVYVEDNTIYSITSYGIRLGQLPPSANRTATNIQILDNNITGCPTAGIVCYNTWDSTLSDNYVSGATWAIQLDSSTHDNEGWDNSCPIQDNGVDNNVNCGVDPIASTPTGNTTYVGENCNFTSTLTDASLDYYIFSYDNGTGVYTNDTAVDISGTSYLMNETKKLSTTAGDTIQARVYVNDTDGNWGRSGVYSFSTVSHPPNPPELLTPANDTRHEIGQTFNLTWSFSDPDGGDTQGAYEVELCNVTGFGSPEYDSGKVSSSNTYHLVTASSPADLYYVRVRVWDNNDEVSPWNHTMQIITDQVLVSTLNANTTSPGVGEWVLIAATARLEYDNHLLNGSAPHNDTLILRTNNGANIAMTYNGTHWEGTHRETTAVSRLVNTYNSVNETTYDITSLSMAGQSLNITWGVPSAEPDTSVSIDVSSISRSFEWILFTASGFILTVYGFAVVQKIDIKMLCYGFAMISWLASMYMWLVNHSGDYYGLVLVMLAPFLASFAWFAQAMGEYVDRIGGKRRIG